MKTNTKKFLSLLLALMMMLSVVPFYASAAEALKAANVTQWPTISYKNGQTSVYYGQTQEMALVINDDEIVIDANGNQVAGHFEFKDPANIPSVGTRKPNIKFVPDDITTYSGFTKMFCADATYEVVKVAPVLVDENDSIPVATEIEPGALLNTSTLSGARYVNPYNVEEPKILERQWEWNSKVNDQYSTYVNESGYYEAMLTAANYDPIYALVYVKVKGNAESTEIIEAPTLKNLELGKQWKDVTFEGGKAVVKGGTEEVTGTYSITRINTYVGGLDFDIGVGENIEIEVTFKPDDTEKYLPSTTTVTVTVNKASIKFVDENGNEVVPEITVPYGTKVGDYINLFKGFATNCSETLRFTLADEVKNAVPTVGTHEYEVTAATFKTVGVTSNYEDTVLKFKVIVEPMELAVKFLTETGSQTNPNYCEIGVTSKVISARPQGTFAIYVDGVLLKDSLKYQEKVEWPVAVSKTYELKVVYTPVDNDPYIIEDYTDTIKKDLYWMFTSGKNVQGPSDLIACGATVEISANLTSENFAGWKVTNAAGEEVDLGLDNTSVKATITMPDYDIHVEALEKNATSGGSGGLGDIDFGDLSEGDSEWAIINIIRNLIAMFKSFLQQLIETFRGIGD